MTGDAGRADAEIDREDAEIDREDAENGREDAEVGGGGPLPSAETAPLLPAVPAEFLGLHPDALRVSLWAGAITWVVLMAPLGIALVVAVVLAPSPLLVLAIGGCGWLSMAALVAFWGLFWPRLAHRHTSYVVDERGLQIRRGVLFRSHVFVARSRIQHSDIAQGPLQRRLGLARLVVHTAGTHNASTALGGIAHSEAVRVRDLLAADSESGGSVSEGDGV